MPTKAAAMSARRAAVLQRQLEGNQAGWPGSSAQAAASGSSVAAQPTSAAYAVRQLPRFDVTLMDHFLEGQRSLRTEVYELFKQHPELLVAEEEGLSKGEEGQAGATGGGSGDGGRGPPHCPARRSLNNQRVTCCSTVLNLLQHPVCLLPLPLHPAAAACRGAPRVGPALPAHRAQRRLLPHVLLCQGLRKVLLPGRAAVPGGPVAGEGC